MIREYQPADLDSIMTIWLQGNQQAHAFIDPNYFTQHYELIKSLIPMSQVYVQDLNGVKGFIGLTDNYISGLFIDEHFRRQAAGSALLNKAKQLHNGLFVHVYKKNADATAFYLSQGFEILSEGVNEETHEEELLMGCEINQTVKIGKCAL